MPTFIEPMRSASFCENSSAIEEWTKRRLAAVQASPPLRIFASTAPSTALSRSASSQTTNGALPPSSIEDFMTLSAACLSRLMPTSVDPVKVTLRAMPDSIHGVTTRRADSEVTTLRTPAAALPR